MYWMCEMQQRLHTHNTELIHCNIGILYVLITISGRGVSLCGLAVHRIVIATGCALHRVAFALHRD